MSMVPAVEKTRTVCTFVCLVCPLLSAAAPAQTAKEMFDSLYAEKIRRVRATANTRDDLDLAREILQGALLVKSSPEIVAVMCDAAYALAIRSPLGLATAKEALGLLVKADPKKGPECREKFLKVYQQEYAKSRGPGRKAAAARLLDQLILVGDAKTDSGQADQAIIFYRRAQILDRAIRAGRATELLAKIRRAAMLTRTQAKLAQLKERLKKDPTDADARGELILMYVVELNKPKLAAPLVDDQTDDILRTYVPMACKGLKDLAPAACLELGQWYDSLARKARDIGKAHALTRALGYYLRFLDVGGKGELANLKAKMATARIRAELKRLAEAGIVVGDMPTGLWPGSRGGLVFLWENSARAGLLGKVRARGSAKITKSGAMGLARGAYLAEGAGKRLLAACKKSNQLAVEAIITPANLSQGGPARIISFSRDGHNRNFTVGQSRSALILRLRTTKTGVNGTPPEPRLCRLQGGKAHHVIVSYSPGKFACFLNGKPVSPSAGFAGDFSNWEPMALIFGDEYRDPRDWAGTLRCIAVYSRTIDAAEAARKYKALAPRITKGN